MNKMMDGELHLPQYSLIRAKEKANPTPPLMVEFSNKFTKTYTFLQPRYPLKYKPQVRLRRF